MSNLSHLKEVKALTFDVFGTVVDWRRSVARELKAACEPKGFVHDWEAFADEWRAGYGPSMNRVRTGDLEWMNIDTLHRMILDELLKEYGLDGFNEEEKIELNKAWHKLDPWPDSVQGLTLLKENYIISSLSNGNVALLVNMAKYGGLPWDTVLSAELVRHYKPDKETYMSTSEFFGVPIGQVMMVAAHKNDLKSANSYGMKTAYVPRPLEHGSTTVVDTNPEAYIDIVAEDFVDLSNKLSDIRNSS